MLFFLHVFLLLAGSLPVFSQTNFVPQRTPESIATQPPAIRPVMMWEVGKEDRNFFLLGSVHIADASLYPLPTAVMKAYHASSAVVFEVNPAELDPSFQAKLIEAGKLPEGIGLKGVVGSNTWAKLEAATFRHGIPDRLDGFQPWYVALVLTLAEMARMGDQAFTPEWGMERFFEKAAGADGKTITGLESASEQLQLLTTLTNELGSALLDQTLDELDQIKEETQRMLSIWNDGDVDALWNLVEENFRSYPGLYQNWLVARNRAWAKAIEQRDPDLEPLLIIVGAAHLAGPDGLPAQLQARGFTVKQVHDMEEPTP